MMRLFWTFLGGIVAILGLGTMAIVGSLLAFEGTTLAARYVGAALLILTIVGLSLGLAVGVTLAERGLRS